MYSTVDEVQRLLWRKTKKGTPAGGITIGTETGWDMGTTDAIAFITDADRVIDNRLSHLATTPIGSPVPYLLRLISAQLAASMIITVVRQYQKDAASNYNFQKQQLLYRLAIDKLDAIAEGREPLRGVRVESVPSSEEVPSGFAFGGLGTSQARPAEGL